MAKLSIVIVNYNAGEHLINCLKSVEKVKDEVGSEVFVVDNASSDGSVDIASRKFPKLNFIKNSENLGFGRANNQVLKDLKTPYVLILNPDTILENGILSIMVKYLDENPEVGAATCKIVFENGKVDLTAHRGFPTPWASLLYFLGDNSRYHLSKADMSKPHEVDAISGAFFLTRKSVLEKVGIFDEDYFMYAEDIDLCFRIKKAGFKIMYLPQIQILHIKGVSSGLKKHSQKLTTADIETKKRSYDYFYSTMKIFYRKHYEKTYPSFINWLVYLAINARWWLAKRKLTV